jgi:hypothetical protein
MSKGFFNNMMMLERFGSVQGNPVPWLDPVGVTLVDRQVVTSVKLSDEWVCLELFVGEKKFSFSRDSVGKRTTNDFGFPMLQSEEGPVVEVRFLSDNSACVFDEFTSNMFD